MIKSLLAHLEKRITDISGKDYSPAPLSFEQVLVFCSRIYQVATKLRLWGYEKKIIKQQNLPCFVISIGNITAGGAGKTPMAVYLAETLMEMGYRPAVLSRGYKGRLDKYSAGIAGDGEQVLMDAETAGDEPFMMAGRKRFPVIVGRNRYQAGQLALERLDVDVFILDDGFQHMALARDLNLVLFDHDRPLGNGRMLPAGRLRETPGMSAGRTHGVILTRCPDGSQGDPEPKAPLHGVYRGTPLFRTCHKPFLLNFFSGTNSGGRPGCLGKLKNKKAVLFSGIAKNRAFRETVTELGVKVLKHLEFMDHYRYKRADFLKIRNQATESGAELILTTEKDWVKMDRTFAWKTDLAVIGIRIEFENPSAFNRFLKSKLNT